MPVWRPFGVEYIKVKPKTGRTRGELIPPGFGEWLSVSVRPWKNRNDGWDRPYFPDVYLRGPFERAKKRIVAEFERIYLSEVLRATRGRVGRAATHMGINERTLYTLMRRHGLRKEDFRMWSPKAGAKDPR
jgi:hypothetical protein